jgi:hypothetical protein
MRRFGSFVLAWPFMTVGLLTFALFLGVEAHWAPLRPLLPAVRVLIVPLWLMRYVEMGVGIGSLPGPVQLVVALPLLFLPYLAADLLLRAGRRHLSRAAHPAPAA